LVIGEGKIRGYSETSGEARKVPCRYPKVVKGNQVSRLDSEE